MSDARRPIRIGFAAVVAIAAALTPAAGDWLVTTDGTKIETRGPWKVDSRLIVFTDASGALASMRLADCDLEASEAYTRAAARARRRPPARPPARRQAVLVLTDADFPRVEREPAPAEPGDTGAAEESAPPPGVVVSDWRPVSHDDGVGITGTVTNEGRNVAGEVKVVAVFRNADGDPIEKRDAVLSTSTLMPGRRADFSVAPFGLFSYWTVDFDVGYFELLTRVTE